MTMDWQTLATALFPNGHEIGERGQFLSGSALCGGQLVSVIGTCGHAAIGCELALAQAGAVLATVREHPGRPIVLLVDTQGQRLRRRDEELGINSYMAHLAKCLDLARRQGHRIIALVYGQALSGGFVASGLMADACHALPDAEIHVMALAAMARVMRVSEQDLRAQALGPGPGHFLAMGGLQDIWHGDLAAQLERALEQAPRSDQRSALGLARGGRPAAQPVIDAILDA